METSEMNQPKRNRKTREERLALLAEKRRQIEMRAKQQLEGLEAKRKRLEESGTARKAVEQERRTLISQVFQAAPEWDAGLVLGAVARTQREVASNPGLADEIRSAGLALQQQLQQKRGRRGRKPKIQAEG